MSLSQFRLEASYTPIDGPDMGRVDLKLVNLSNESLSDFRLSYSAIIRLRRGGTVTGLEFVRRVANYHEFKMPEGQTLEPGGTLAFTLVGLSYMARHRLDGPKSAYLTLADGRYETVETGDLLLKEGEDSGELKHMPAGKISVPVSIVPWPQSVEINGQHDGVPQFRPADDSSVDDMAAIGKIAALAHRLFPAAQKPFRVDKADERGTLPLSFVSNGSLANDGYELDFGEDSITLSSGGDAGRDYGLIVLAQMHRGAICEPNNYCLPTGGKITDAPRYGWRGTHFDVSRHFWPTADIYRILDILAWNRMNIFHWHLTDDEGWRLEIKALPELTQTGAQRGADCAMVPQLGSGFETYQGFYTQEEVREIVAHAGRLHIEIVPEIDTPGHCTAVLKALPHLVDPDETPDSYHSVQGYANNALNPAMPETYEFMKTVLNEIADLFPSDYIHIGGDEVDEKSWLESPLAQKLMQEQQSNIGGTMELQAHFMRKVKTMVSGLGKKMAGWDEVSHGGGVDPNGTLLVAWQKPEVILSLAKEGYEVIASPGQAYYLDMVQASGWQEPGTSWAGVVPPQVTYEYEADGGLPAELGGALKGLQACMWCEHILTKEQFNHMAFPRLSAVAEAGWTRPEHKDWQRFAALSRLLPEL